MAPKYDDDEEITDVPQQDTLESFDGGKTTATFFNKNDAPLTETNLSVLMKLTGSKEAKQRAGLDLVIVLDVSGSMKRDDRIGHLKTATQFLIKKLSPLDRLSVIKFSTGAERLCPLRQMKGDAASEIEHLISQLKHGGYTNMTKALAEAVKVVNDRRFKDGREVAVMFMSDGEPNPHNQDGSQIDVSNLPVYTFGLGQDCDHRVLSNIARKSKLATFSTADVGNAASSNLSVAFSQCLAGLLTVIVQDLTLTIKPQPPNSTILNVSAGKYEQTKDESDGSITISFGNLYSQETRNVLVDLLLPEVKGIKGTDVLEYTYSYKDVANKQEVFESNALYVSVKRTQFASDKEDPEVALEKARQNTVDKMKTAMEQADGKNYDGAKDTIKDAQNDLKNNGDVDASNPNIKALESELNQLIKLLEPGTYESLGRAFVMAALLSHSLQRFAARGNVEELRLFATDAMNLLLDQVTKFEKDPTYVVPTPDQDKEVLTKDDDPLKVIAKALSVHLGQAIKSLQAIEEIIKAQK